MFKFIAARITKWLLKKGAISSNDIDLYLYAIDTIFFSFPPLFLTISVGLVLNMFVESLLLLLPFVIIRKFSGGFHLKSPIKCLFLSSLLLLTMLLVIRISQIYAYITVCTVLTILSSLSLCLLSPIDSVERQLTEREICMFKHCTIYIVIGFDVLYFVFLFMKSYRISTSLAYGILLPAILQLPCLIPRKKDSN